MNFESHDFRNMTSDAVYHYVKDGLFLASGCTFSLMSCSESTPGDAVNSFRVDLDCDIYVTGSNAYLLSSEYSTYLSGRCVEIKMLPLSFREFLTSTTLRCRKLPVALAELVGRCLTKTANATACGKFLMPICALAGCLDRGHRAGSGKSPVSFGRHLLHRVVRDILEREKRRGQRQITDSALLRKIVLFLADNIGSSPSVFL